MVERGPYVSYANCGLPYHVGGVIEKESSLLVANEQLFREQFAIDVRTNCEVIEISPIGGSNIDRNVTREPRPSWRRVGYRWYNSSKYRAFSHDDARETQGGR